MNCLKIFGYDQFSIIELIGREGFVGGVQSFGYDHFRNVELHGREGFVEREGVVGVAALSCYNEHWTIFEPTQSTGTNNMHARCY